MTQSGYLDKDEKSGLYSVSLKFLPLSRKALQSLEIRRVVMPFLEMLRQKYPRANLNLGVLYQGEVVVIDRIDSMAPPWGSLIHRIQWGAVCGVASPIE